MPCSGAPLWQPAEAVRLCFFLGKSCKTASGQMRQDICLKRAAVTFIVEPSAELADSDFFSDGNGRTSAIAASVRIITQGFDRITADDRLVRDAGRSGRDLAARGSRIANHWKQGPQIGRGQAEQLTGGRHVAIIAWGPMVAAAYQAAESLAQYGIEAAVINARFAQPLDARNNRRARYAVRFVRSLSMMGMNRMVSAVGS